jgi:hypothetical protein
LRFEEKLKKEVVEDEYAAPEWDDPVDEEFVFDSFEKEKEKAKEKEKEKEKEVDGLHVQTGSTASFTVVSPVSPTVLNVPGLVEAVKSPEIKVPPKPPAPVFDMNLLRYHQAIRNPFIQILMDYGVLVGVNSMTFTPGTKPYEKIWFYKDLDNNVQGPFSTLEMFAWTIRDCFPPDLEISIGTPGFFVPMNIFNECSQFEKEEEANEAPAVISDSNFSLYKEKVEPPDVISLDDMQGSVFVSREKPDKIEKIEKNPSTEILNIPIKIDSILNSDKTEINSRPSIERPERKPKPPRGKAETHDHRPDRAKVLSLEEIEKMQQHRVGKAAEPVSQTSSKTMKSNDAATFELKNMLGLISKK